MRTIWHSLAWKEWHEHKWKLAAILAVFLAIGLFAFLMSEALALIAVCMFPFPIFVALGSATNERSQGTLQFLQSLPVPMWRVALNKLAFGLFTILAPIVIVVLFAYIASVAAGTADYSVRSSDLLTAVITIAIVVSLYVWSAAAGVNCKDAVSGAAIALPVMMGYWLLLFLLWEVLLLGSETHETALLRATVAATAPGGPFSAGEIAAADSFQAGAVFMLVIAAIAAVLSHSMLLARFIRRYGRISDVPIVSSRPARVSSFDWLPPPRRSPLSAIAWKQFRESGPIVLIGITGALAVVTVFIVTSFSDVGMRPTGEEHWKKWGLELAWVYIVASLLFGFFTALVVGIGISLHDTTPNLNTFWRSRPIQPDQWFWAKFLCGLGITIAGVYLPLFLIAPWTYSSIISDTWSSIPLLLLILAQVALFAAAVAMTVLVRHAVYAAILSVPAVYAGVLLVTVGIVIARLSGWMNRPGAHFRDLVDISQDQFSVGLAVSIATCTILAWLAMRYDWGRKSRY